MRFLYALRCSAGHGRSSRSRAPAALATASSSCHPDVRRPLPRGVERPRVRLHARLVGRRRDPGLEDRLGVVARGVVGLGSRCSPSAGPRHRSRSSPVSSSRSSPAAATARPRRDGGRARCRVDAPGVSGRRRTRPLRRLHRRTGSKAWVPFFRVGGASTRRTAPPRGSSPTPSSGTSSAPAVHEPGVDVRRTSAALGNLEVIRMIALSDKVFGWDTDYDVLFDASMEAIRADPGRYVRGVGTRSGTSSRSATRPGRGFVPAVSRRPTELRSTASRSPRRSPSRRSSRRFATGSCGAPPTTSSAVSSATRLRRSAPRERRAATPSSSTPSGTGTRSFRRAARTRASRGREAPRASAGRGRSSGSCRAVALACGVRAGTAPVLVLGRLLRGPARPCALAGAAERVPAAVRARLDRRRARRAARPARRPQ